MSAHLDRRPVGRAALRGYLRMWAMVFVAAGAAAATASRGRPLVFAAGLLFATGLVHSVAGERFLLVPLFRRELPRLLGDRALTRQTLRFAWHEMTVALWAVGALLVAAADGAISAAEVARTLAAAFAVNAVISFVVSRGRHLSWAAFAAVAVAAWLGAPS